MIFDDPIFPQDFKKWIWKKSDNKILIMLTLISTIILYIIFIRLYPFPNFLPDSYSYIDTAYRNNNINIWPVGYSKFLRFISVFNHTDKGLFLTQYFILQSSILLLLLTVKYLLHLGKWYSIIVSSLLLLNPLNLYVSNFISSDSIFAAFSLLWLTSLIWIIFYPGRRLFLFHGLTLAFVFSVRYNALYYPIISLFIIVLFTKALWKEKLLWAGLSILPVVLFIGHTIYEYKQKTDTIQFSPFGGWQLASNAMYMYSHVSPKTKEPIPLPFKKLHTITTNHMDSIRRLKGKDKPDNDLGIYYLWNDNAPLRTYFRDRWKKDSTTSYLKRWALLAPVYGDYGAWLIKQFPLDYIKYYLWPNMISYYAPPTEFLGIYNMGSDSVDQSAVRWFGYKTSTVRSYSKDKKIRLTEIYTITLPLINIVFFTGFLGFFFIEGFKQVSKNYKKTLYLTLIIWSSNLFFSVFASPIVLRYQMFPMIFTLTFGAILLSHVIRESFHPLAKESKIPFNNIPSVIN